MLQVRVHGRGGQGVVTAAELLSIAAFLEGRHAQAFPAAGEERTGAPVVAFCRIDDREIRGGEPVVAPDVVIVQDPALLGELPVLDGLGADGYLLVNSTKPFAGLGLHGLAVRPERRLTVPATELARELIGRPVPNSALLGGFAALSGLVSLVAVTSAIRQRFPRRLAAANVATANTAFHLVRAELAQVRSAHDVGDQRPWPAGVARGTVEAWSD